MFPDVSQLLTQKLGVKFSEVKTNKHAAFGAVSRPLNAEETAMLEKYIDRGYNLFRKRVADGRKLSVDQVEQIAQGRVWLGSDALPIKLVDAIGSLDDAVKKAAELAKLKEYHATSYPEEEDWLSNLFNSVTKKSYLDEEMQAALGEYYEPLRFLKSLDQRNAIQARLPYIITIK
jgi:protease-4